MPISMRSTRALVLTFAVVVALCTTGSGGLPPPTSDTPVLTSMPDAPDTEVGSDMAVSSDDADNDDGSASPTAVPTSTPAAGPSSESMPVGDLPGWRQIFTEDFTTSAPVGSFTSTYGSNWSVYLDGWPDTSGKNRGTKSGYYPSRVISVSDGVLNEFLHVENGTHMAAAILPKLAGQLYGKYTVRFKSDTLHDFKTAWLLWPDNEIWPGNGEIDFPEGRLDTAIGAFLHHQGATSGKDQDAFPTDTSYTSWHTASIEWLPTATNFILDGKVIGTSTSRIPNTRMHYVLQTESCLDCTYKNASGNLQIDWVVVYAPAN
jgi:hypothetical protein